MYNYEVIEGSRKYSFVYANGGYTYRKGKDAKGIRYLRCTKFREGCPALAEVCLNSNVLSIIREHENHDESESEIAVRKVLTQLKRRAEDSEESLRELFDEEVNESEIGGQIIFVRVVSTMFKRRRLIMRFL